MTTDLKINYQFIPSPRAIKNKMRFSPLTGNEYRIMDLIIDIMASWPETRQDFQKELSGSYLAKNINLSESAIYRAISGLIRKEFLTVVNEAKKGVGRVIKILFDDLQFSHIISGNKERKLTIKENNNMSVVSSKNTSEENKNQAPQEKQNDTAVSKTSSESKSLDVELLPPPPLPGIHKHTIRNCVKILQKRNITDMATSFKTIADYMQERISDIKNKNGYITQLAKTFDFNSSSAPTPPVPAASGSLSPQAAALPETKTQEIGYTATIARKQQIENEEKFTQWEKEKRQEISSEEELKIIETKYPAEFQLIKSQIDKTNRFITLPQIKNSLYLAAFREKYPDLCIFQSSS